RPLFGERFEHVGRFVADDVFAFGHRADQAAEHGQPAEGQVGRTIVDPDLRVHLQEGLGRRIVANAKSSVRRARDHTHRVLVSHRASPWQPDQTSDTGAAFITGGRSRTFENVHRRRMVLSTAISRWATKPASSRTLQPAAKTAIRGLLAMALTTHEPSA